MVPARVSSDSMYKYEIVYVFSFFTFCFLKMLILACKTRQPHYNAKITLDVGFLFARRFFRWVSSTSQNLCMTDVSP